MTGLHRHDISDDVWFRPELDKVAENVGEGKNPQIKSGDKRWSSVRLLSARWPD